jgi:hypothetical protein
MGFQISIAAPEITLRVRAQDGRAFPYVFVMDGEIHEAGEISGPWGIKHGFGVKRDSPAPAWTGVMEIGAIDGGTGFWFAGTAANVLKDFRRGSSHTSIRVERDSQGYATVDAKVWLPAALFDRLWSLCESSATSRDRRLFFNIEPYWPIELLEQMEGRDRASYSGPCGFDFGAGKVFGSGKQA